MKIDLTVTSALEPTARVLKLGGMFDVPIQEKLAQTWAGEAPIESRPWNVGLIVGPSGCGKSRVGSQMFGEFKAFAWSAASVVDDFAVEHRIQAITDACSAVGFNTIPSWMKPYGVLSNGEKFRVELARHLLESGDPIVVDEFTSVVDRQVAQIASHAVQKYVRKNDRKFVAISCHYDIMNWLQPDWVLEPATMTFQWRAVQRRPSLSIEIAKCDHAAWKLFAPFHYMSADLTKSAQCYVLFVDGGPATFCGVRHMPHPSTDNIKAVSRVVTLPDYQGFGLAFVLLDTLGAAHRALRLRFRNYPAHPAFVRAHDQSKRWALLKKPGQWSPINGATSGLGGKTGGRPCAVFEYCGQAAEDEHEARQLLAI